MSRAEIEDRVGRDSFVLRVISEAVIEEARLTIYRSRRKTVLLEWLRSQPTQQYSKVSVTFSIALLIISA